MSTPAFSTHPVLTVPICPLPQIPSTLSVIFSENFAVDKLAHVVLWSSVKLLRHQLCMLALFSVKIDFDLNLGFLFVLLSFFHQVVDKQLAEKKMFHYICFSMLGAKYKTYKVFNQEVGC